jgi:hypothetical protein
MTGDLKDFNHVDLLFPGNYLKPGELRGRVVNVTIEDLDPRREMQTVQGKKFAPVLLFRGAKKPMVLNNTNADLLAELLGTPHPMEWIGKHISLRAAQAQTKTGKKYETLRVGPAERTASGPAADNVRRPDDNEPPHDSKTGEVLTPAAAKP